MPKFVALLTLWTLLFAYQPVNAELGFYPKSSPNIPFAVNNASKGVYEIFSPKLTEKIDINSHGGFAAYKQFLSEPKKSPTGSGMVKKNTAVLMIQLRQIQNCEKRNQNICEIWSAIRSSSGFVTGDGSELWTAYHCIQSAIEPMLSLFDETWNGRNKEALQHLKRTKLPILIFDWQQRLVFDFNDTALIDEVQEQVIRESSMSDATPRSADMVKIKLFKPLDYPLVISQKSVALGEPIYAAGFSAKTTHRSAGGFPDSSGSGLHFTYGKTISARQALWYQSTSFIQKVRSVVTIPSIKYSGLVFANTDGYPGMSGGPFLNQNGEVVGMLVAIYNKHETKSEWVNTLGPIIKR